jgi:hypothetical protein
MSGGCGGRACGNIFGFRSRHHNSQNT